jgi:hypothetical protein
MISRSSIPVAALPQNTPKFTEALKQHGQIAVLHIATGPQAHIFSFAADTFRRRIFSGSARTNSAT